MWFLVSLLLGILAIISTFRLQKTILTFCVLWVTSPTGSDAYPGGTPDSACESMFPSGHGVSAQKSRPPYEIRVPKTTYNPGETITVQLMPTQTGGWYRGVYLQARQIGCGLNVTRLVGVFTSNDMGLQTRHCFGRIHSTLTHTSNSEKGLRTVYWTAPVVSSGHVAMTATFVKSVHEFWTDVQSQALVDLQEMQPPRCLHRPMTPVTSDRPPSDGSGGVNSFHVSSGHPVQELSPLIIFSLVTCLPLLYNIGSI